MSPGVDCKRDTRHLAVSTEKKVSGVRFSAGGGSGKTDAESETSHSSILSFL